MELRSAAAPAGFVLPPPAPVDLPVKGRAERFPVRRIYCVGRNYLAHIREMKEAEDERDPPFFFQKPRDAIVPDGAEIAYPPDTDDYQFEVELAVAIGGRAKDISVGEADGVIFGYAVCLDMTRRDRQRDCRDKRLPWEAGKAFDQSAPCGPIIAKGAGGDPSRGAITLAVNGVERQRGDLSQMIWSVPEIVANLSRSYVLEPGDLIMTGTPAGVGPVGPGDVIVGAIDGFGSLTLSIAPREA
ncbi:fumarylacetoacetate hydrolase family protein [Xanthobacter dioxanivorans]|uniref:Fumarylacetoacetate hydrolase family protein n=1 Tax=Xanthobacter dioxanivorans TaxID=2528964 RepID=A0A974PJ68_9HYPH|nr:fumarylacetoacetate hydrolase family protein [Xanthobacter dioxanivorans]QRG04605.1 fumarylacetoacetate hydrolase family protein [Xanthobacter dioxanivorans]